MDVAPRSLRRKSFVRRKGGTVADLEDVLQPQR